MVELSPVADPLLALWDALGTLASASLPALVVGAGIIFGVLLIGAILDSLP